jgi:hypothetical protein
MSASALAKFEVKFVLDMKKFSGFYSSELAGSRRAN